MQGIYVCMGSRSGGPVASAAVHKYVSTFQDLQHEHGSYPDCSRSDSHRLMVFLHGSFRSACSRSFQKRTARFGRGVLLPCFAATGPE